MQLSARFIRATLKNVAEDAVTDVIALADALKAFRRGKVETTNEGLVVTSTAGNGRAVTFSIPGNLSPVALTELGDYLEVKYDEARARLIADGIAAPTDAQIKTEMLDKLQPVTRYQSDFTMIAK